MSSDPRLVALANSREPGERIDLPAEANLAIWALTAPPQGAYAKTCAAMSLEVAALRKALETAVKLIRRGVERGESCFSVSFANVPRDGCRCFNCAGARFVDAHDARTGAGTAAREGGGDG